MNSISGIRLSKLRTVLADKNLDAILISTPSNLTYLTSYPFEKDDREAFIVITKSKAYCIASPLIKDEIKKLVPNFIFLSPPFSQTIKDVARKDSLKKIGVEADNLTLSEYKSMKMPSTKLIPLILTTLRDVKDKDEIAAIEKACQIGDDAYEYIVKEIRPGMSEKDIALLLDTFVRQQGTDISFRTIIAFGKNAAIPHHIADDTKLKNKDIILLDFGAKYNNYCSDMSRTIFVGKPTDEEKKAYETVRIAQEKAIEYLSKRHSELDSESQDRSRIKSGMTGVDAKSVDKIAREYIVSQGYPEYPHSLGHSIGIDVHDGFRISPTSENNLIRQMVFSIEPGIYLSQKFGIRIEDIVVLEKNGPRFLTKSPRTLTVI